VIREEAIGSIEDEHRSLGAVIHGLEYVVRELRERGGPPDFRLLHAMLLYVREYPEKLHHPAEDRTLFARLALRTREADATIAELEREHAQGDERLGRLTSALSRLEAGAPGALEVFASAVRDYAEFHWAHMRKEEEVLIPIAGRVLGEDDWREVRDAFRSHRDPGFGGDEADAFRRLFTRIVTLAPAPIGVGDGSGPGRK
jgi:hemerythrin-like domain-containing protein